MVNWRQKDVKTDAATETKKHLNVLSIALLCFLSDGIVLSSNMFCNQYKCPYLFGNELVKGIHLMRESGESMEEMAGRTGAHRSDAAQNETDSRSRALPPSPHSLRHTRTHAGTSTTVTTAVHT